MIWVKLIVILFSVAFSAGELDEIPPEGITYKVKYDVNQYIVHAQDIGYSLAEARKMFYVRDHPPTILTIANYEPEYTLNMVRNDLTCPVRFTENKMFYKASFLFFKAAKSVYKVERNRILGIDVYDNGAEVKFVAILLNRGLNITIASKSRTSQFFFPLIKPSDIER